MNISLPWWGYVICAGLAWGVYVPLIFYGGTELTTRPGTIGGRLASILCVGIAYFLMAVVIPLVLMVMRDDAQPEWKTTGLIFSGLAGVAGAIGAICVIFASKAAVDAAKAEGVNPATYRVYIAPLIFEVPGWKLPAGIVLVALGTFLVLMSKEEAEAGKGAPPKPPEAASPPA
jgi:hypothetical protein